MAGVDRLQAAERRSLDLDRPDYRSVARDALGDPLAQQLVDQQFELVGSLELMKGPQELAIGRPKPSREKAVEVLPLRLRFFRGIGGRLVLPEHINVGVVVLPARVNRG